MTDHAARTSQSDSIIRLKPAKGHLRSITGMLETGRPCAQVAAQIKAAKSAIRAAGRTLIHDHIHHRLGHGGAQDLAEICALTKLL